ncbi:MAG: lysine biosynthesis protein LysW [Candidatus Polarisedimenticolia bacterium]
METMIQGEATCPACDGLVTVGPVTLNELIRCRDCGSDLEVTGVAPLALVEAPAEEEDWGE